MSRLVCILLLVVVASAMAFNSPVKMGRVATRAIAKTPLSMSPSDVAVEASSVLSQFSQVLASESDFGGYAGPAGSLILIGILILSLAPPLKSKNDE